MAPRNALANISFTVDSASEDDMTHDELNAMPTPDSNTENKAPGRKARGKAAQPAKAASAAKATTKGKSTTRAAETKKENAATKKAPAKAGRKALAERKNGADSDADEADELDEDDATEPVKPAKRGRPPKAPKVMKVHEGEGPTEEEPAPVKRGRKAAVKESVPKKETKTKSVSKSRSNKRSADSEVEPDAFTIPETQAEPEEDPMDIEDSVEIEEIPESMPPPPRPSARTAARRPAAASRTRQPSTAGRRAGSLSDTERDPAMRRKVGDLTKKLEAMTAKYETLKDVAMSGKESSFEQLRKRTEQVAKGMGTCSIDSTGY